VDEPTDPSVTRREFIKAESGEITQFLLMTAVGVACLRRSPLPQPGFSKPLPTMPFSSQILRRIGIVAVLALGGVQSSRGEFDPGELDPGVKPQDDFFRYVKGRWIEKNPIPADRSRWGVDMVVDETNATELRSLCETAANKGAAGTTIEREVGDLYASGMDQAAVDAAAAVPLDPELKRIADLKTPAEVLAEMGHFKSLGIGAGFRFQSGIDDKDSRREIAEFFQGGLGLPDRDDYFRDDEKSKLVRSQYVEHVKKCSCCSGTRMSRPAWRLRPSCGSKPA
jgi:predicted metalloendopeptidase